MTSAFALAAAMAAASCADPGSSAAAVRSLDEIYDAMRDIAKARPAIARVVALGDGGSPSRPAGDPAYPVLALEIGGDETLPAAQVVGAIHGDEEIGAELALAVASRIAGAADGADRSAEGAAALIALRSARLTFVPAANPWGYAALSRGNAAGTDLNRNFPWAWGYEANDGDAPLDAPESAALAADAIAKRYALSISLHSGSYRICLPWDYIGTSAGEGSGHPYTAGEYVDLYSPAHELHVARAAAYAALVEAASGGGPGSFPAVQGFDWYFAGGTFADWLYGERGCAAYTVELSEAKSWRLRSPADGGRVVAAHEGAILALLASAGRGAAGRTLGEDGSAVEARVTARALPGTSRALPDPEPYAAFAFSGGPGGRFAVPLPRGEWELRAVALSGGASGSARASVGDDGSSTEVIIVLR